jgi:hypothetical protein
MRTGHASQTDSTITKYALHLNSTRENNADAGEHFICLATTDWRRFPATSTVASVC